MGDMMNIKKTAIILTALAFLAACGNNTRDRAITGAGIGAGVGAIGGAITGGNAGTGALIGAGVGAAAGGLTDEKDVNLGKPLWKQ